MKSQRKLNNNRWVFEQLENRNLLAGNVTTSLNGDQLVITGDASANVLLITQTAPNTFKITGGGTKVDGHTSETISGVTNMFIDMGAGNDALTIKGVTLSGNSADISLGILLGDGSDALVLSSVTTNDACGIDGGSGNNAIVIDKSSFGYDLGIQTYSGVDAITITRSNIFGALSIQMGDGTNALTLVSDNVTEIESGGLPTNELPEGFEVLNNAFFDIECGAQIEGGSGVDAISMVKVNIDCETEINTFGGNDSVAITNSRFGNAPEPVSDVAPASIGLDGSDDSSGLCIETGTGNDAVAINATVVYGFLQIDTSGDYDCPTDEICDIVSGAQPEGTEQTGKDGNDVVALNNVQVLQSQEGLCLTEWCDCIESSPSFETNGFSDSTWFQCSCELGTVESGMLLIYTGNQTDSVALNKVTTDAQASIYTTDESNLDGADAVAITNSSFNQDNEVMECEVLPLIEVGNGLSVETGYGNDAVTIVKVKVVGEAAIETDGGTDAVAINSLTADFIFADLGSGNYDTLTVAKSVSNSEEFDGGGNTGDTLVYKHLANNFANPPLISGFANVL